MSLPAVGGGSRHSGSVAQEAARALAPPLDPERHVEPADGQEPEQLAHGEQVQGDLEAPLGPPLRARRPCVLRRALVVADDRAALGVRRRPGRSRRGSARPSSPSPRTSGGASPSSSSERPFELLGLEGGGARAARALEVGAEVGLGGARGRRGGNGGELGVEPRALGGERGRELRTAIGQVGHPRGARALPQRLVGAPQHRVDEGAARDRVRLGLEGRGPELRSTSQRTGQPA